MLVRPLKDHDVQVSAFEAVVKEKGHADLLDYIAQINAALLPPQAGA